MKILFQNRSVKSDVSANFVQCDLEPLLQQSDVVSLNCPLTDSNAGFINKSKLELMKPSAVLINTGRGPLINASDLADALT